MGLSIPSAREARGRGWPSLEQTAAGFIGQGGVPWQHPSPVQASLDVSPHTLRPMGQHKVHMVWYQTSLGSQSILLLAVWLRPGCFHPLKLSQSILLNNGRGWHLPVRTRRWALSYNRDFQSNLLFYFLTISEEYNQCNKPLCCSLIASIFSL